MAGEKVVEVPWKAWALIAAVIAPMITAAYFIGTVVPQVQTAYAHSQTRHAQGDALADIGQKLDALTILITQHIGEAEVIKSDVRHMDTRVKRIENAR